MRAALHHPPLSLTPKIILLIYRSINSVLKSIVTARFSTRLNQTLMYTLPMRTTKRIVFKIHLGSLMALRSFGTDKYLYGIQQFFMKEGSTENIESNPVSRMQTYGYR